MTNDMNDNSGNVTPDDKLWAALAYPIPFLVSIIVLLMEEKKERPFIKFHAVQALGFDLVLWVFISVFSMMTIGLGVFCIPLIWLVTFWPAIDSYNGNYTQIPVLTDFIKNQGWV